MKLRYIFILIPALLLLNSQFIRGQQKIADFSAMEKISVFKESFDNNTNNWITDNSWINGRFENGNYLLKCKNYRNTTGISYKTIQLDQTKDFEIEAIFKIIKGAGGLIFGMTDKFDHYRVDIVGNNIFIAKNTPSANKIEKLYTGNNKTFIKSGNFNKLTIRKITNDFYFFADDSLIFQLKNVILEGNQIGFNVGVNSEISVDNLTVSYIKDKTKIILADNNQSRETYSTDGPLIEWISPSALRTPVESFSGRVRALVRSKSGIRELFVYVNGVAAPGEPDIRSLSADSGVFQIEKTVNFIPGENNIYLVATNTEGSKKSDLRYFTIPSATLPSIRWQNPVFPTASVNRDSFAIEVCIQSLTDLKSVKVLVNGDNRGEDNVLLKSPTGDCNYIWQRPVNLKEGDNVIIVQATNIAGTNSSDKRIIRFQSALADNRIALVLGNADYENKPSLKNPVNDANLMEATLEELGFKVIKKINAGKKEMEDAIMEFNMNLPAYNVALFYYAGHGIQVDGINYLIPTDAKIPEKINCQWEAIAVNEVVGEFKKYPNNINIVILDACRNNPFQNWVRGDEAGFKFLPNVSGTIIGYATVEGATAADGSGKNGIYTEELVKQMVIPQPVESVFKKTRVQVEQRSKGTQSPQETTGLRGDFYFKK